jgi:hypothetical protein
MIREPGPRQGSAVNDPSVTLQLELDQAAERGG